MKKFFLKSLLFFFTVLIFLFNANAQKSDDNQRICEGYYITNDSIKVPTRFIVGSDIEVESSVKVILPDGSTRQLVPRQVTCIHLEAMCGNESFSRRISLPAIYEPVLTRYGHFFMYKEDVAEPPFKIYKFFVYPGHGRKQIEQVFVEEGQRALFLFYMKIRKRDVKDDTLLVNLMKHHYLRNNGDHNLIIDEYITWRRKQFYLQHNDTLQPVFSQFLSPASDTTYTLKALIDADRNYRAGDVFWTSFGASIAGTPAAGVTAAIIMGTHPVSEEHLHFPNEELKKNDIYYSMYRKRAVQKKINRALKGFFFGMLVFVSVGCALTSH